jgi:acetoin utilization deacetylase AcuC-like enzyme
MGFCLLGNVAIAARYAQKRYGVEKVAIVDWDVHHGNGTQDIFWRDPSVLFISTHQYPLWPGTGAASETGDGPGEGYTVNIPLPPGSGEAAYLKAFRETIIPRLRDYRPQMLFISAGFDAHLSDPLAQMELRSGTFAFFTTMLRNETSGFLESGIVSMLEGGYDLKGLCESVEGHIRVLAAP